MGRMRVSGHGKVILGLIIQAALGRKMKFALLEGMLCIWFVWSSGVPGDHASPGCVLYGTFPHFQSCYISTHPHLWWNTFQILQYTTNTFLETTFAFTPMGPFHSWFRFDAEIEALIFTQTNSVISGLKETQTSPKLWLAVSFNLQDPRTLLWPFAQQSLAVLLLIHRITE